MPWRNFYNDKLETYTTTDMSAEKLEQLKRDGWREANDLEFKLANAIRGYDPNTALETLQKMVVACDADEDFANCPHPSAHHERDRN